MFQVSSVQANRNFRTYIHKQTEIFCIYREGAGWSNKNGLLTSISTRHVICECVVKDVIHLKQ